MNRHFVSQVLIFAALTLVSPSGRCDDVVEQALAALRSVGAEGAGFDVAIPAAEKLRRLPSKQIPLVLDAMEDVNPVAENWLRGVVFDLARKPNPLSVRELANYVIDRAHNPIGRGLAMELLRKRDPDQAAMLISACMDDLSLPLREMAVEQAIESAKSLAKSDGEEAKKQYRKALTSARHPKQLSRIIEALGKLGEEVKTADAFALIRNWKAIAPFDNVDGVGYEAVYPPESQFALTGTVDLSASHQGKTGSIKWQAVRGSDDGVVDLAETFNKEKGAICYLYTAFVSAKDLSAEARLGCINANKIWINGREVMANKVYHSGSMIDQYTADFDLKKGKNTVLLKICQNEQTEPWAQKWEFQFRITDRTGKGLTSTR